MTKYKHLPLDGLKNARDLGGFPTKNGKVTKYGVFVRSEVPAELTDGDREFLKKYGITMSLDFRGEDEIKEVPSALASEPGHLYQPCPMFDADAAKASIPKFPKPGSGADAEFWDIDWVPVYINMMDRGKVWVRRAFEYSASWDGGIIYHCFTGKDRTGIFTALLLGVCGVDILDIMADYSLSMVYLRPFYDALPNSPYFVDSEGRADYGRGFYRTAPETMLRLTEYWEKLYGGIRGYVEACGVSTETVDKIVLKMTEEPEI